MAVTGMSMTKEQFWDELGMERAENGAERVWDVSSSLQYEIQRILSLDVQNDEWLAHLIPHLCRAIGPMPVW